MAATKNNRGVVLIIVLAVLVVLALLVTMFASLQGTEREVARNYVNLVRAKLAAEAGVDYAISELERQMETTLSSSGGAQPWRYYGMDDNENGTGNVNVPLEEATNPSFAQELETAQNPYDSNVIPRPVRIEGKTYGLSGVLSGSQASNGEMYALKVSDASGKIHLNEGVDQLKFITAGTKQESTGTRNLRRILNHLGNTVSPAISFLGDKIIDNRPDPGYQSVLELKKFLPTDQYAQIADFVTTHAWQDSNVANPVPFSAAHAQAIQSMFGVEYWRGASPAYRFGRGLDYQKTPLPGRMEVYPSVGSSAFPPNGLTHAVYAMDELNPQWVEVTSRAPVNVNVASREVLIALLSDLRGVFLSERRRNNFVTRVRGYGGYSYIQVKHTFSPAPAPRILEQEGDELGFLYETYPIAGAGGTGMGISPADLADAIIACRNRATWRGFDFATAPFGGPFRTWRQFNAFCDLLVPKDFSRPVQPYEILVDPRGGTGQPPVFFDYSPTTISGITGNNALIASDFQRLVASQAIADVLKANFNPNLHLNELNPDRNLFTFVDKTDLVVNSTEFCFAPTGYYDVESIGRVLRPKDAGIDALLGDNELLAESKVHAGVKLFDVIRQTSQSQFAAGTCAPRTAGNPTNNNRSLEVGPEPDNGPAPQETIWSGYVAFPTLGGNFQALGATKAAGGAPLATPLGSSEVGETIHSHFSWDFDAHYHLDGDSYRKDLGSSTLTGEYVENYPDPGESAGGPYDPVDQSNRYRLARSFRYDGTARGFSIQGGAPTSSVTLDSRAPMDLRIDGGYFERHSGLAYWISRNSYVSNTALKEGVISYWVKPNFDPARSGKPRMYADMCRRCYLSSASGGAIFTAAQFVNFWNAGHDVVAGTGNGLEMDTSWGEKNNDGSWPVLFTTPFRPQAMHFGVGYGERTGFRPFAGAWANYYQFMETSSLNHEGHGDGMKSQFNAHEWMHVALIWKKTTQSTVSGALNATNAPYVNIMQPPCTSWTSSLDYKILVNGKVPPVPLEVLWRYRPPNENDSTIDWTVHCNGDRNSLRFGSLSRLSRDIFDSAGSSADTRGANPQAGNFSADSTLDEIYFWNRRSQELRAVDQWHAGRYSWPRSAGEGIFTSAPIVLPKVDVRVTVPPPGGTTTAMPPPGVRLLGISWTWYAERNEVVAGALVPALTDHSDAGGFLFPKVDAAIVGVTPPGIWLTDDGYSAIRGADGNTPVLAGGAPIQYCLRFTLPGVDPLNTVLLSTPVADDVTMFVSVDQPHFTYFYVNTTTK